MTKEEIAEVIEATVQIRYSEKDKEWAYFPFHLYFIDKSGEKVVAALVLGGDVQACYSIAHKYLKEGATQIVLSIDFPPTGDIATDFVGIFCVNEDKKVTLLAMPYDSVTGEWLDILTASLTLGVLKQHFLEMSA